MATTVREYVFYVFENPKKRDFLRFFDVAFQKNVNKRKPKIPSFRTMTLLTFRYMESPLHTT